MDKFIALFCIAVGAVYSDTDSSELVSGRLFPAVFILGVAYLFWFKGLVAIVAGTTGIYFSDLSSNSALESILLPIFDLLCFGYLIWWAGANGLYPLHGMTTGVDAGGGGDGGCDGGGGGDGC